MTLKPVNLIQAAQADLRRRARNIERYARGDNSIEQYAFLAQHVRTARDVSHLLQLAARFAARHPDRGEKSAKKNTRLIYGNRDLLAMSLAMAGGGESEQDRTA